MSKETGGPAFPNGEVVQSFIPLNEVLYEVFGMRLGFHN